MNRTKIIATIGPASGELETMVALIQAGMNVARLNFSHGSYASHTKLIENIRAASKQTETPIGIIQDLSGPKLRLGEFHDVELRSGDHVVLGHGGIPVQRYIWEWIERGQTILLNDGLVELLVTDVTSESVEAKVMIGGRISSHQGISLPGIKVNLPILSEKDLADLEFGIKSGVDFIAMSFIKTDQDIDYLRKAIQKQTKKKISIIAKIETPEAVKNIDKIIAVADAIMVARGDLALNMPQASVIVVQKQISEKCVSSGTPVIIATQIMGSMIRSSRPTSAELSDIANSVIDHVDAVMLSGETAFGKYPITTVETMAKVIEHTEISPLDDFEPKLKNALIRRLKKADLQAVVVGGLEMAKQISRFRMETKIVLVSKNDEYLRAGSLFWGVIPIFVSENLTKSLSSQGLLIPGQKYLNVSQGKSKAKVLSMG